MPIYVFIDTETEEEFEDILTFYEKEDLLKKNPIPLPKNPFKKNK
jgi:hypothetical protein